MNSWSGDLSKQVLAAESLVEILEMRAQHQGDQPAYTFLSERGAKEESCTWRQLALRARIIGGYLSAQGDPGDRVILFYPPGLEYISAFLGCLYARMVAVPLYPPRPNQKQYRAAAVILDCGADIALTSVNILPAVSAFLEKEPAFRHIRLNATEVLTAAHEKVYRPGSLKSYELAFLQYTSGSTGRPKGVMISHRNLLANQEAIGAKIIGPRRKGDLFLNWLPLYHDMGLIGTVLHALYRGIHSVLMPSLDFIQDPTCWLEAITRFRATVCGGPNFAYELCLRKVTAERMDKLDLSSWRVAINGAEPVRWDTLNRFAELFAAVGFRPDAFYPCYGLAEATLLVTGGHYDQPPRVADLNTSELNRNRAVAAPRDDEDAVRLVGSGGFCAHHQVVIAHPESRIRLKEGEVGEIWVSGPSIARGYWNQPERSMDLFQARLAETMEGPFLRTGDLGFLQDGELFVTGRLKELIIIRGRNHYAQDIEWTVAGAHTALKPDSGAAFAVKAEGEERLVVAQEVLREWLRNLDAKAVVDRIRLEVLERHEVQIHAVVLLKPGRIPKTSSGKIQRNLCRDMYLGGRLEAVEADVLGGAGDTADIEKLDLKLLAEMASERRTAFIEGHLRHYLSVALQVDVATLDPTRPLSTMGLDSMVAMDLQHYLEAQLGVALPLTYFLEGAGLEDLAITLDRALTQNAARVVHDPADVHQELETFPLSYNQRALWFLNKLAPESAAYNVSFAVRIRSALEAPMLRGDFQALLARHPSLRTVYQMRDNRPYQRVLGDLNLHFVFHNATGWHKEKVDQFLVQAAERPFDLETGPLLRVDLLQLASREHVLLLTAHHIAVDFWSVITLMDELGRLYGNDSVTLPPPAKDYSDYVRKQERLLKSPAGERLWHWWRDHLADQPPPLELPIDRQRPATQTYGGDTYNFQLPLSRLEGLKELARAANTTLFTVVLAVYQTLLHRYSGQRRILVGSPTSGRMPGFEDVVGYFVNPVVLRADFERDPSFMDFLHTMRRTVLDALDHRDFPFQLLVERLQPERDPSRSPLFQVMFVFQKPHRLHASGAFALNEEGAGMRLGGLDLEAFRLEKHIAQFDLTLSCIETAEGLNASLEYNTDLFDVGTIARMAEHFQTLAESVTSHPEVTLSGARLLPEREMRLLLVTWNGGGLEDFPSRGLHRWFEEQAARFPGYTAVQQILSPEGWPGSRPGAGLTRLTYGELNRLSDHVAAMLQARGVGRCVPVGLSMERSVELIVAILAVLKAGGFYVPLDPSYPEERLTFMVQDSGVKWVICSPGGARLWDGPVENLEIDTLLSKDVGEGPAPVGDGDHPAYMIYTSGSTGRPKGVLMPHRGVSCLLEGTRTLFGFNENDTWVMFHSYAFDVSVWEIFGCLLHGGRLLMPSYATTRFPEEMTDALIRHEVTIFNQTPSAFRMIRDHILAALSELKLRAVIFAGEDLEARLLEPFETQTGEALGPEFYNLYGITETTVHSTWRHVRPPRLKTQSHVGVSLPGEKIFILDRWLRVCPIGVPGEIHVWGGGLAFGYHRRPDLTASRFIPCPTELLPMLPETMKNGARLYCSGDLGRYVAEGELVYLGRIDHQVKIRGFRVELGEIEHELAAHAEVKRALVVVHDPHEGYPILVAYVQPKAQETCGERRGQGLIQRLREHMAGNLPDYMNPSRYIVIQSFPLTPNGKVNRKELPAPEEAAAVAGDTRDEARTPTEELVEAIWIEVLEVDTVGLHTNFFKLGGHSLMATQVMSRIAETFNVTLPIRDMFEAPTVAGLSARLNEALRGRRARGADVIKPAPRTDNMPLSFAQQRLWLLDRLEGGNAAYNMPAILRLEGDLDHVALAGAVTEIVRRHEVLRASFFDLDGQPVQVFKEPELFVIDTVDLSDLPEAARDTRLGHITREEVGRPFDLSSGPLLRVILVKTSAVEHVLLLTMHHIVSDGWSIGVMIRELAVLYEAFLDGKPSPLPELGLQYADFAHWQRHWLSGEVLEDQLNYWRDQLKGAPEVIALPTDHPRPKVQTFAGSIRRGQAPPELTPVLHEICHRSGTTMFMTLLAAWVVLLHRYSGQSDVSVGSPIANRNRREIEPLIGFFVNTLVFRTDLTLAGRLDELTFEKLLLHLRQIALGAYSHQDISFEQVVNAVQPERDQSHTPLFQVMFALQNVAFEPLNLPGLTLTTEEPPHISAKFGLNLSLQETPDGILMGLEYNTDLFEAVTVQRMLDVYIHLLKAVAEDRGLLIDRVSLCSPEQQAAFLKTLNGPTGPLPEKPHVLPSILAHADDHPAMEAVASVNVDGLVDALNFGQMRELTLATTAQLGAAGIKPGVVIAVCLERTPQLPAAILGVWAAGAVYLPLDPSWPHERLVWMLADSGARALLTSRAMATDLDFDGPTLFLEDAAAAEADLPELVDGNAPAYMMYTSGADGEPQSVLIHHAALWNVVHAAADALKLAAGDVQLAATGVARDSALLELFTPLVRRARLLLAPANTAEDAEALIAMMTHFGVSVFQAPASTWRLLADAGLPESLQLKGICGGEVTSGMPALDLAAQGVTLWNAYGPAETAVYCAFHLIQDVDPRDSHAGAPPVLGTPLPNTSMLVLDRRLTPTLSGIVGEVCIGGLHLGQGYHGRPDLTALRFVPNPWSATPGERLFRSGDLARVDTAGRFCLMGRLDHRLKLRGYRIEPAEIEREMNACPGVQQAFVMLREDRPGDQRLAGYFVFEGDENNRTALTAELEARLARRLPAYMLPHVLIGMHHFPLRENGTVAVTELTGSVEALVDSDYTAPRQWIETELSEIWAEVLGLEKVGIHTDFFDLGGHSLLATRALSRIRDAFSVELPLRSFFESPTVAAMSERIQEGRYRRRYHALPPIARVPRDQPLPLSYAQQRMWFLVGLDDGPNPAYCMASAMILRGELDLEALEGALTDIEARHESLRTCFFSREGEAFQRFRAPEPMTIPLTHMGTERPPDRDAVIRGLIDQDLQQAFDFENGRLLRVSLTRLSEQEHLLIFNMHHIISDGWSIGVFVSEVSALYARHLEGTQGPSPLKPLEIQYADFAEWQRRWLSREVRENQLAYWKQQLAGKAPLLDLPTDRPRPKVQTFNGGHVRFTISKIMRDRLMYLAQASGSTLFMCLYSAWCLLLSRYSNMTDIWVGTPVANRNRSEVESLIGLFVNTLVLRLDLEPEPGESSLTFAALLARARHIVLNALARQDLPFEQLVDAMLPRREMSYHPLFQAVFILQNTPRPPLTLPGLDIEELDVGGRTAKFDLTLAMVETEDGLTGELEYNSDLFNHESMRHMVARYRTLLESIIEQPRRPLAAQPMVGAAEMNELLAGFNHTDHPCALHHDVVHIFEKQVSATPGAVAVREVAPDGRSFSYDELARAAARIQALLRAQGVGPGARVGVLLERTVLLPATLLGILKAGAAYVPLDPRQPLNRLRLICGDAHMALILTDAVNTATAAETGVPVLHLSLDDDSEPTLKDETRVSPQQTAYVIYTSGSTGRPKGVTIPHGSLANLLFSMSMNPGITKEDVLLSVTTMSFDIFGLELFLPLVAGATLVLGDDGIMGDGPRLREMLVHHQISMLQSTPAGWRVLMQEGVPEGLSLKGLCGGEALPVNLAADILNAGVDLYNVYGPTETTIWSTVHPVAETDLDAAGGLGVLGIGRPIANTRVYVLDRHLQPAPAGLRGQLYIGGYGLASGYHGRPDLTAERFIPDPFATQAGARLYHTGDQARIRFDKHLEFLGRADFQIKLRGYRIEPAEVERALVSYEGVRDAVVILREDVPGNAMLAAYYESESGRALESVELREFLAARLPNYMVPAALVFLASFPRTPSGKLDRGQLPRPDFSPIVYSSPRDWIEEELCTWWAELLGLERIGIHQNFFEAGGHSLLVSRVLAHIHDQFGVQFPLRVMFECADVAGLSDRIRCELEGGETRPLSPIRRVDRNLPQPLSPAQLRMWFLIRFDEMAEAAYHIPLVLTLTGSVRVEALQNALSIIIERHAALRTTFHEGGQGPEQRINPASPVTLPELDLRQLSEFERHQRVRTLVNEQVSRPFDLGAELMMRSQLIQTAEDQHLLVLVFHHIVTDGWSLGVFIEELGKLYSGLVTTGEAPRLERPQLQYVDYSVWLHENPDQNQAMSLAFWKTALEGYPTLLELPLDRPRPPKQTYGGGWVPIQIEARNVRELNRLSHQWHTTLFMTVQGLFSMLLSVYSGMDRFLLGTAVANRNRRDLEPLIGLFVNTVILPVDLRPSGDHEGPQRLEHLMQTTRTNILNALSHQDAPFEAVVQLNTSDRRFSHNPLFQVVFSLHHHQTHALDLPDLNMDLIHLESATTKFDLTLGLEENEAGLSGFFEYNTALFDRETMVRMAAHFRHLVESVVHEPGLPLHRYSLLDHRERHLLLVAWNGDPEIPIEQIPPHQMIERLAAACPDAPAVTLARDPDRDHPAHLMSGALTFGRLNSLANGMAHRLVSLGAGPEVPVMIIMDRGLEMITALLAVLKTGSYYVPLDPDAPAQRLAMIVEDISVSILVTTSDLMSRFQHPIDHIVVVDREFQEALPQENLNHSFDLRHPAYTMFTSGSTGRPKGVQIPHLNLKHLIDHIGRCLAFGKADACPMFHSYAFDYSVMEIWGSLCNGARLVITPHAVTRAPDRFLQTIREEQVTVICQTPTAFRYLIPEALADPKQAQTLRLVVLSGEALEPEMLAPWYQCFDESRTKLVNLYGITETTVYSTLRVMACADCEAGGSPIGKPLAGLKMFVLDDQLRPRPVGVPGELFIWGWAPARGYFGRPDLTAARFVPCPESLLSDQTEVRSRGGRMYRSGDLARTLPNGDVDYIGRLDDQVQIRGFRVELGEIEAGFRTHPTVSAVKVLLRDGKRLLAWIQLKKERPPGEPVTGQTLRIWLRTILPDYMIPQHVVILDAMPMTHNGKIDQKALPEPQQVADQDWERPVGRLEADIAAIWSDLLGRPEVGRNQGFFDLGGQSLLIIQLAARLREAFGVQPGFAVFFEHTTVAEQAAWISQTRRDVLHAPAPLTRLPAGRERRLVHAQERMWRFIHANPQLANACNIGMGIHMRGPLDTNALQRAFLELVTRHEALRTAFVDVNGQAVQQVQPARFNLPVEVVDSGIEPNDRFVRARIAREVAQTIDLTTGDLVKARLLQLGPEDHVLVLIIHHLVCDGWSLRIMVKELSVLYPHFCRGGSASPLPPPSLQLPDFAAWHQAWLDSGVAQTQLAWWRSELEGVPELLNLPLDRPRAQRTNIDSGVHNLMLDVTTAEAVRKTAQHLNLTPFVLLETVYAVLLARLSGQTELCVGVPVANRPVPEAEALVGYFVNFVTLRHRLIPECRTFRDVALQTAAVAAAALERSDVPFTTVAAALVDVSRLDHAPLFQVKFNMPPKVEPVTIPGLQIEPPEGFQPAIYTELHIDVVEREDGFLLAWIYQSDLFDAATMARMAERYQKLLSEVLADPDVLLTTLLEPDEVERAALTQYAALCAQHASIPPDPSTDRIAVTAIAGVFDRLFDMVLPEPTNTAEPRIRLTSPLSVPFEDKGSQDPGLTLLQNLAASLPALASPAVDRTVGVFLARPLPFDASSVNDKSLDPAVLRQWVLAASQPIAARLAQALNLNGPWQESSEAGTAVLRAVHLAVDHLLSRSQTIALTGGLLTDGASSPRGAGLFLLKRWADVPKTGSGPLALIRGRAWRRSPSVAAGVAETAREALRRAGLKPEDLDSIECMGGPHSREELEALTLVFGPKTGFQPTLAAISSESDLTGAAASLVGLIRTILALNNTVQKPRFVGINAFGPDGDHLFLILESV